MFGMRIVVCIPTDKRHEFFQSVRSLSPEGAVNFFYINEDTQNKRLLNLTAEFSTLEALASHLLSERFKVLLGAINALGSLEDISMNKSIQVALKK
ncbi:MAG: hypothetical protein GQ529_08525 [Methyloprofundus sp.]|nr:hypothetical protein [Methyloprofundus sp.]